MIFTDWGQIPYLEGQQRQLDLLELVAKKEVPEQIILCSHPSVVTLGKGSSPLDILGWKGETIQTSRGGKATYHGPQQLVIYPILNLDLRGRDLHRHLRMLEEALIHCLKEFYNTASTGDKKDGTGVWVKNKKIASIGIAVRKWISYHGMAVNLNPDPLAFSGISPCGFDKDVMTCLAEIKEEPIDPSLFKDNIRLSLQKTFSV